MDQFCTMGDAYLVKYELNGLMIEDRIIVKGNDIGVISGAGWTYRSGKEHSGEVRALEKSNESWSLELDRELPDLVYIRLDLPGGDMRYYPVKSVSGKWIQLEDDPGFTLSDGKARFHTFPHDVYDGPLRYTVFESTK